MNRRIRINGRLYEQVSAKRHHRSNRHSRRLTEAYYDNYKLFPERVGRWDLYGGDESALYCYDDIPYVLVAVDYYNDDDTLSVSVWFYEDANPGSLSGETFIEGISSDEVEFAIKHILKSLELPFKKIAPKIDSLCFDAMQDAGADYLSYDVLEPIEDELDDYLSDLGSASSRILKKMKKELSR